jgi:hypothetical protein
MLARRLLINTGNSRIPLKILDRLRIKKLGSPENFVKFEIQLKSRKRNGLWLSVMVSVIVLLGVVAYGYIHFNYADQNQNLGTYDNPEIAFREAQSIVKFINQSQYRFWQYAIYLGIREF